MKANFRGFLQIFLLKVVMVQIASHPAQAELRRSCNSFVRGKIGPLVLLAVCQLAISRVVILLLPTDSYQR